MTAKPPTGVRAPAAAGCGCVALVVGVAGGLLAGALAWRDVEVPPTPASCARPATVAECQDACAGEVQALLEACDSMSRRTFSEGR